MEGCVLGAALLGLAQAQLVARVCHADDFYREANRRVLAEIKRLVAAGQRPDGVLVAQVVPRDDRPHVLSLWSYPCVVGNAPLYVGWLKVLAARRRLQLITGIVGDQLEEEVPLDDEVVRELIAAASDPNLGQDVVVPWPV